MGWSWRLGRLFGIDVRVHPTFLILLGWVGLSHVATGAGWAAVLGELGFLLLLFGIVVLHELGHALAARRYGIRTRDITLLPFGGIARLERIPEEPGKELVIALAGPAVNVALAAGLFGVMFLASSIDLFATPSLFDGELPARLFWVNVWLAAFNMIPAFPMDGGRVLRALLAFRGDYLQATRVAAGIGQGIALLFGLAGLLLPNPLLFCAYPVLTQVGLEENLRFCGG
jgi:Zn-dependent protease